MLLRILLCLSLAGCALDERAPDPSSDPAPTGDPPPAASAARQLFDATVHPVLVQQCGTCHGAAQGGILGFVAEDPARAYELLLASPVVGDLSPDAPIAKIISRNHPTGLPDTARAAILSWLEAERTGA